jgi:Polyketide cyclase / dehydrase and lipid transport
VDVHAELLAPCSPDRLFAWVDDLSNYPQWMRLAHRVEADVDGVQPAWRVELRARLGPMARSKRLRMVRSERTSPTRVTFTREENDGRTHSPWVLTADVEATETGSRLKVHLHYGGGLWTGGLMERALTDEIERGRVALGELVATAPPSSVA